MNNYREQIKYFYEIRDYQSIANIIISLSGISDKIDISKLLDDPSGECAKLNINYIESTAPINQCIYGNYDNRNLEIKVYLTSSDYRNLFTLVHEIGHHLIQNSEEWLHASRGKNIGNKREKIEEKIANAIASEFLIPSFTYQKSLPRDEITPKNLVSLYGSVKCSTSALLYRVQQELNNTQELIIGASDLSGKNFYSYSLMTGSRGLLPLAKDSNQRALSVIGEVLEVKKSYKGVPREPFMSKAGTSRGNFYVEAMRVEDADLYFFCMKLSKSELSSKSRVNKFCSSCSLELKDLSGPGIRQCEICREFICEDCFKCLCQKIECPPCESCFITISVAQVAQGKKVCESCE